jgi:hypothetical protein
VAESIGAGEGNRTLVFSLEGFRRLNTFNARSDKNRHFHSLNANALFALSERGNLTGHTPGRGAPVRVIIHTKAKLPSSVGESGVAPQLGISLNEIENFAGSECVRIS